VSVVDPDDPAATGFDVILARDAPGTAPRHDLSALVPFTPVPVAGVVLAPGQAEYGTGRRHDEVHSRLTSWLSDHDCALVPLDTRLDTREWRSFGTPDQLLSVIGRLDIVVTTRLHGLVGALRCGVPALAVDPVADGAKLAAQARTWDWPAVLTADEMSDDALERWWRWCLSEEGRTRARTRTVGNELITELLAAIDAAPPESSAAESGSP
jgi:hypothetical protein